MVTLPYNLLLSKTAREALGIDMRGHIVIVDEAHSTCFYTFAIDIDVRSDFSN